MNNTTEQTLVNVTAAIPKWQRINMILYLITGISSIWTIGANLFIFACFVRNRHRKWTSFTRQTCSMTASDLLVGLTAIQFLVIETSGGRTYGFVCLTTFYLLFSVQCVTLYHVLGICIFRNINLISFVEPRRRSSQYMYANCVILLAWMIPGLVILMPFLLWGQHTDRLMDCYVDTIFETEKKRAVEVIALSYFVCQCLTNVIYVITCCRLFSHIKKVSPTQADTNDTEMNTMASQTSPQANTTNSRPNNVSTSGATGPSMPSTNTLATQKRVLGTIGLLLLMFNVFTFPMSAMIFNISSTSRNVRFTVGMLFIVNSGLNPIVYATRIASLREEAIKIFREICFALRFQ